MHNFFQGFLWCIVLFLSLSTICPNSFKSKRVVTSKSVDHVILDGYFEVKGKPPKTLSVGDTVNFFTN